MQSILQTGHLGVSMHMWMCVSKQDKKYAPVYSSLRSNYITAQMYLSSVSMARFLLFLSLRFLIYAEKKVSGSGKGTPWSVVVNKQLNTFPFSLKDLQSRFK